MASKIVSVRIDRDLLAQLEEVARLEQRSLSGQIVQTIRKSVSGYSRTGRPKCTMGMFRGRKIPSVTEIKRLRANLSTKLPRRRP